jgi:DNA-binding transcriptional MerR regulator
MEVGSRIPEKLFFRIGEVCELIKVQPHVLRYWETEFPMLAPQKNRAGQRVYRRKDVEMVFRIRDLLYEEKFTIAGAKKRLLEESRAASPRARQTTPEGSAEADVTVQQSHPAESSDVGGTDLLPGLQPEPRKPSPSSASISPHAKRLLRLLKTDLEDLLTRLEADASIKR